MAEVPERIRTSNYYEDSHKLDLREAVERLDESLRIVIHLFYFQDLPIKEIASVLDITDGAVRARLHRARGILFDQVKQNRKGSWPMNPFDLDKELREIGKVPQREVPDIIRRHQDEVYASLTNLPMSTRTNQQQRSTKKRRMVAVRRGCHDCCDKQCLCITGSGRITKNSADQRHFQVG